MGFEWGFKMRGFELKMTFGWGVKIFLILHDLLSLTIFQKPL